MSENYAQLVEQVKTLRENAEKQLKEHDVLLKAQEERLTSAIEAKSAQIQADWQKAEAERKALEDQINSITASVYSARGGKEEKKKSQFQAKFADYIRRGVDLTDQDKEGIAREVVERKMYGVDISHETKALLAGSNPDGGFFVTADIQDMIMGRVFETSPVRLVATVTTTSSDRVERVLDDDEVASGGWVGEQDSRDDTSTPQVGQVIIPIHEQYAQPKASQKMIQDAGFDIEGWLRTKLVDKFTREENKAFVSGNGSSRPKGFLTYAAWSSPGVYQRNAIEQVNSGSASTITPDGFKSLQNSLKEYYQANAIWGMKRSTWSEVTKLKDLENRYLFEMTSNFRDGDSLMLLGKRVVLMDDMPAIAGSALPVVYGDFKAGYEVVDRVGINILRDPYTAKPYVRFYTTKRVGGAVINYEALKLMKIST